MAIRAPRPLTVDDRLDDFDSGEPSLDSWLRERAAVSARTARTYVLTDADGDRVIGYYCLSSGALIRRQLPGNSKARQARARQGLPEPVPVILMGRMAIDKRYQGRGLGADLLQDAVMRAVDAARQIAAHGLLVQALTDKSVAFYRRWGFTPCRDHPMTLLLSLNP